MKKAFAYQYNYDKDKDDFYACVTGIGGLIVYEIVDTAQMLKIIKSGEMEHIDDVDGLTSLLTHDKIIPENSTITFTGVLE